MFQAINKKILALFFLLLIIGVFLRLPDYFGHSSYAFNELGRDMKVIQGIAHGDFPMYGTRSSINDFHFGPIYYYLYFPVSFLFNFAPFSLAITSLVFSILTIILAFFISKMWWKNDYLSILLIFLMIFSTADIQFAKYGSNPNLIPFFTLLFFFGLNNLLNRHKYLLNVFIMSVSFAIATQLHAVCLVCLPIILFVLIITKKIKLNLKAILIFIFTNLVLYSPYLFYELTNNFYNLKQLLLVAGGTEYSVSIFSRLVYYIGFWLSPIISTNSFFDAPALIGNNFIYLIIILMLFFSPAIHLDKKIKFSKTKAILFDQNLKYIFKLWLLVPSIVLLLPIGNIVALHPYYFFILSPLAFFIYSLAIYRLWGRGFCITASYLLLFFLVLQATQLFYYQKIFIDNPLWGIK